MMTFAVVLGMAMVIAAATGILVIAEFAARVKCSCLIELSLVVIYFVIIVYEVILQ
jgi:hypothetical protein